MNPLPILLLGAAFAVPALADDGPLRQCRGLADPAQRLACYDAIPLPAAAAATPSTPAAALATAPKPTPSPSPEQAFGRPEPADRLERIDSRIEGRFEGWQPGTRLRLANGQVWQVADDSRGAYWLENPRVTVRRGALGSYLLEIDGVRAAVRVRRVD